MKNKRIFSIVLNNFTNDSRVLKEGKTLNKAGYNVTIIALHEDGLQEQEVCDGLNVRRLKLITRNLPRKKFFQAFKYIEFTLKAVFLVRKTANILHCHDLNTLPIGIMVKKFSRNKIKVVYDAHEYETETNGTGPLEKKVKSILETSLIHGSDKVITVSDSIANEYVKNYSLSKPYLVLNTPFYRKAQKKQDLFRETLGIRHNQIIFLYQGALTKGRGIQDLITAFASIECDKQVLVFMGYGLLEAEVQKAAKENDNIFFLDAVSPNILLNFTSSADFGISLIEDTCLSYRYCLPNKLFEYLMVGLPVIVSDLPEMKKIVSQYEVGIIAKDNSIQGIVDALNKATLVDYEEMYLNSEEVRKLYSWEVQEIELLKLYSGLDEPAKI